MLDKAAFHAALIVMLENNATVTYGGLTIAPVLGGYEIREPREQNGYAVTSIAPERDRDDIVNDFLYLTGVYR